ncbi:hypothetical protein M9H77_11995 [Catharanthus roseus]|uniref:Uncharacterized protein n=1 Tax=Catharanthus roseus TaxID=4058 RepID=A0ACC0BG58_CATRO|nr:hypothetical protein M9H77_11995 [Catharanthus roseus]
MVKKFPRLPMQMSNRITLKANKKTKYLDRAYGRVGRKELKLKLLNGCVLNRIKFHQAKVWEIEHEKFESTVVCSDDYDKMDTMVLMDWRDFHLGNEPNLRKNNSKFPKFLYAMSFSSNFISLEETSLVSRPVLSYMEMKKRIAAGLRHLSIKISRLIQGKIHRHRANCSTRVKMRHKATPDVTQIQDLSLDKSSGDGEERRRGREKEGRGEENGRTVWRPACDGFRRHWSLWEADGGVGKWAEKNITRREEESKRGRVDRTLIAEAGVRRLQQHRSLEEEEVVAVSVGLERRD